MAIGVVDLLEAIEIDRDNRKIEVCLRRRLQGLVEPLIEGCTVENIGQRA